VNVVMAWKNPEFRESLSEQALSELPEHPCGSVQLTDDVLVDVRGAATQQAMSWGCCGGLTAPTACGSCGPDTCGSCDGCTIAGCTA
jgi:mersacidin/lichenicidin family type 2 lantibiotic